MTEAQGYLILFLLAEIVAILWFIARERKMTKVSYIFTGLSIIFLICSLLSGLDVI